MHFYHRMSLVLACALSTAFFSSKANAQSSAAEQIIGGILQQLAEEAEPSTPQDQQGVFARRWNNRPGFGSTSVTIKNESNSPLRLGFALPGGGGTSVAGVPPRGSYTKTGLPTGTSLTVSGPRGNEGFVLSGGGMRIFVSANGDIGAISNAGPAGPGQRPQIVGAIKVTNRSNLLTDLTVTPANPGQMGAYMERLRPGGEWIKELPVGTKVNVSANGSRTFQIVGGMTRVYVNNDGSIRAGNDWGGFRPPGPGLETAGVRVTNQSAANVRVTFSRPFTNRTSVAVVVPGDTYTRDDLTEGARITFSGSVPQQTITLRGGRMERVTVTADGRVVVGHVPLNPQPGPGGTGDVEVVNRSGDLISANFGLSTKSIRHNSAHTFMRLDAGRVVQITTGDTIATFTHRGDRERIVVRAGGSFDGLPAFARVTRRPGLPPFDPDTPDNPPPPGPNNPDPVDPQPSPDNPDPPVLAPANALPLPEAAPLRESVVARFARKTKSETEDLLDLLDAGSAARVDEVAKAVGDAGVDAGGVGLLKNAALAGEPAKVGQLASQFDNLSRNKLSDELATLTSIARLREHLLPLERKVKTGATKKAVDSELRELSTLATNLGDEGLSSAIARIRRDLLLRDTITQGLETTGVGPSQMSLPQGEVNVISHPWITKGNTYFAESGLLLVGSGSPQILVTSMSAVDALRLPIAKEGNPIPDSTSTGGTALVVVRNPAKTRTRLSFKISDRSYTLDAGKQVELPAGGKYIIEFSRGSSGESSRFDISAPGIYTFAAGSGGWQLSKQRVDLKISNPKHGSALVYVVDGIAETLAAGATTQHQSNEPIALYFDTGEGNRTAKKQFTSDAEVHFAVNPQTGYWDLFTGAAPGLPKASGDVVRIDRPTLADVKAKASDDLFDFGSAAGGGGGEGSLIDDLRE